MNCAKCNTELAANSKFCPECGTPVPSGGTLKVQQDIGTVKGNATGVVLGQDTLPAGLSVDTSQKVNTVEAGGAAVGAVIGGQAPVHIGGEQHYGDKVQGDKFQGDKVQGNKQVVHTDGGVHIGGSAHIGGDVVGRDKVNNSITVGNTAGSTGSASMNEIARLFAIIYQKIQARPADPDVDKDELKQTVQQIEKETAKGERANAGKVEGLLKTLASMAPDIGDVVIAALTSPAAGIASALRKVAEKAKAG